MLIWEWRRRWRQYIRFRRPPSRLTYQQITKRYTIFSAILFIIGWHLGGFIIWRKLYKLKEENPMQRVSLSDMPKKGFMELAETSRAGTEDEK